MNLHLYFLAVNHVQKIQFFLFESVCPLSPACVGDVDPLGVHGVDRLPVLQPADLRARAGLGRQALEHRRIALPDPHRHRHHLEVVVHHCNISSLKSSLSCIIIMITIIKSIPISSQSNWRQLYCYGQSELIITESLLLFISSLDEVDYYWHAASDHHQLWQ